MADIFHTTQSFDMLGSQKVACLVAGYGGTIAGYQEPIKALNDAGYSVVAYDHSKNVMKNGRSEDLLKLIDDIQADFSIKSNGYKEIIFAGASMGAGIAFSIQRRTPQAMFGIYATAGVPVARNVFVSPLFIRIKKTYIKNGYTPESLQRAWQAVEALPDEPPTFPTPVVMMLGKRDKIVNYTSALKTLHTWQKAGIPIRILTRNPGHLSTVRWFKKHIPELLKAAEEVKII